MRLPEDNRSILSAEPGFHRRQGYRPSHHWQGPDCRTAAPHLPRGPLPLKMSRAWVVDTQAVT